MTEEVGVTRSENGQTYVGIVEEREATAVSFTGMGVVKGVLVNAEAPRPTGGWHLPGGKRVVVK